MKITNILKCKHDANKDDCTIKFKNDKLFLVYPPKYDGICPHCGKKFTFTRDEKTKKFKKI